MFVIFCVLYKIFCADRDPPLNKYKLEQLFYLSPPQSLRLTHLVGPTVSLPQLYPLLSNLNQRPDQLCTGESFQRCEQRWPCNCVYLDYGLLSDWKFSRVDFVFGQHGDDQEWSASFDARQSQSPLDWINQEVCLSFTNAYLYSTV